MQQRAHRLSIFSASLDVAAFAAYFLGAVVPLVAFAYLAHRYVLQLSDLRQASGVIAMVVSIAFLSLGSYLLLRRITRASLARMERHNRRLSGILEAAQAFSVACHRADAAETLATCSSGLVGGCASFVLVADKPSEHDELTVLARCGPESDVVYESRRSALEEAAREAMESGRPLLRGGDAGEPAVCCVPIDVENHAVIATVGSQTATPEEIDALSTLAALGAVALRNSELQDMQRNFFVQMTDILLHALDQHLSYHEGHGRRVAHIANRIGRELGLDDRSLERLHFASLLHDIGMLRIPAVKHSDKKAARMHPVLGQRMLSAIRLWQDLAPFVLYHHERFDGRGYPEGLAGDEIPIEARIIGLAEAVDSMISTSSYKDALSVDEMLGEVEQCSGSQFDPEVARTLLNLVERGAISLD